MATWETTSASAWWSNGQLLNTTNFLITRITDNKSGETTFELNESLTIIASNTSTGTFVGTLTVNGVKYPVVKNGNNLFAVGLHRNTPNIPETLSESDLDTGDFTVCFFPGTLVATPSGERKVEKLVAGDTVLTKDGREIPAKFVGRQSVSTRFGPAERLMPVRFAAGSLGGGGQPFLPHSELTVTADHAMLVDGVLCEAGALLNGTTIIRVPLSELGESYTVYHVETEAHEFILANGVPAETFVDNVSRRVFDNYAEFEALYGEPPELKELPYPRAANARHLPLRIKNRLGIVTAMKLANSA